MPPSHNNSAREHGFFLGTAVLACLLALVGCQQLGAYERVGFEASSSGGLPRMTDLLRVLGGGASLPNRVYQDTIVAYRYAVEGVAVSYTSLGSGGGKCRIKEYEANCGEDTREPRYLDFAASDSLLTESDYQRYPDLQMLPTLASAVVPVYNLFAAQSNSRAYPPLRFDRLTLARVFRGEIVNWRDPAILALNPALRTDMPDACIQVVARNDSSGTTEIFKKALSSFDSVFRQAVGTAPTGGRSGWPTTFIPDLYCRDIEFRDGNRGVASYVLNTPGAIGYVSLGTADYLGLQKAWMMQGQNAVEPTAESAMYAALEKGLVVGEDEIGGGGSMQGECEAKGINNNFTPEIIDSHGMLSWPISGLTYLIVRMGCPNTRLRLGASCENVRQTALFWQWFYTSPAVPRIATETGFAYLPPQLRSLILDRLHEMRCRSELVLAQEERILEQQARRAQVTGRGTMFAGPILHPYASMYQRDNGIELLYTTEGSDSPVPDPLMFRIVPHVEASEMANDGTEVFIPWLAMPVAVIFNVPELKTLVLDSLQLARLVSGSIVSWNDAGLVALNPALANVTAGVELVLTNDPTMGVAQLETFVRSLPGGEQLSWELPELSAAYIRRSTYPQVEATVREVAYTVGFAPMSVLQNSPVKVAGLLSSGNAPESTPLQPSAENVAGCFLWASPSMSEEQEDEAATSGLLLGLNHSSAACYPLTIPLYVALRRDYTPPRGAACDDLSFPATQTVRWWEWLLLSPSMGAGIRESLNAVHVQLAPQRYVLAAAQALDDITCSGNPILQPEEGEGGLQGVPLAIVAVVVVLLLVIMASGLAYTWYRHRMVQREYRSLQLTTHSTHWDTESPYAKVIRYLKNVSMGEKLDRSEAARLVLLLQNSNNIQAPAMLQENGRRGSGTNQLARYLMSMADNEYGGMGGPRSESGDSAGGSIIADGSVHRGAGGSSVDLNGRQQSFGQEDLTSLLEAPPVSDFANSIIRACWFEGGIFPEDLMAMLANLGEDCFFDVVGLYELMGQRPLATVSLYLLHKFGLVASLCLDEERLEAWLLTIEDGYVAEGNPFTNQLHAADVVARFSSIAGKTRGRYAFASDTSLLAGFLAAIIHDYGHTGKSNSYHVALGDFAARQFNDQQVLENLSLQKALDLLATPRLDFMHKSKISNEGRRKIRTLMIEMVLATDMSQHFDVLQRFQAKAAVLQASGMSTGGSGHGSGKSESIVAQVILKAADLGFYAQPLRQHLFWCKALQTEMFQQGDAEKQHKLPVSPMCDRTKPGVMHPKNQLGFIDVVLLPLYAALHSIYPGTEQGVEKGLTQLRATMDFYRLPKSETVTEKSLEAFREELVSQSTERYESVVGAMDSVKLAELKSIRSMRIPKELKDS